jgi:hypothetical protein
MSKKRFVTTESDITGSLAGTPVAQKEFSPEGITHAVEMVKGSKERPTTGKNKGLKVGEERVSFVLKEGQYEKLQNIAYWERETLKDTVIGILEKAFAEYETKNGELKPRTKKK